MKKDNGLQPDGAIVQLLNVKKKVDLKNARYYVGQTYTSKDV